MVQPPHSPGNHKLLFSPFTSCTTKPPYALAGSCSLVLLKHDGDNSLNRLREAETSFANLIQETTHNVEQKQIFEAWRLACLANHPNRQDEAIAYCRSLLNKGQPHYRAIIWASSRNFEIDLTPNEASLARRIKEDDVNLEEILSLVGSYLPGGKYEPAFQLLQKKKNFFIQNNADTLMNFWMGQTLVLKGETEKALLVADSTSDLQVQRNIRTLALKAASEKSQHFDSLVDHLESCFATTGEGEYLLNIVG